MKLLVNTIDNETPIEASREAIHSALSPLRCIEYGTNFSLTFTENNVLKTSNCMVTL